MYEWDGPVGEVESAGDEVQRSDSGIRSRLKTMSYEEGARALSPGGAMPAPDPGLTSMALRAIEHAPEGLLEREERGEEEPPLEEAAGSRPAEAPEVLDLKATLCRRLGLDPMVPLVLDSGLAEAEGAEGTVRGGAVHLAMDEDEVLAAEGKKVLAHELIHLAQGQVDGAETGVPEAEREADEGAEALVSGRKVRARRRAPRSAKLHKKSVKAARRDRALRREMKRNGIINTKIVMQEARRAGIPLSLACSMLIQESGGGHNVFGHDAVSAGQIVGGKVTRKRYKRYKKKRKQGLGMQGVGPMQLTWYTIQDKADKMGGCWKPRINMRVGFQHLRALMDEHGHTDGIRRYNGSGAAAHAYAKQVIGRKKTLHKRLRRAAEKAKAKGGGKGDSPTGGIAPDQKEKVAGGKKKLLTSAEAAAAVKYNRGRSRFWVRRVEEALHLKRDGKLNRELVQAAARFQKEKGLTVDGMVGPSTYKAIRRHLRNAHGLGKKLPLTKLERREARQYNEKRNLKKSLIRKLQKKLGVSADGIIGPRTMAAVCRFQRRNNLSPTGKLGPATIKRIRKSGGLGGFPKNGSNSAKVAWAMKQARKMGLVITSTTGGKHTPGSYHYSGRAFDCAGSASAMARFYKKMKPTRPTELFYDPLGGIKHGQEIGPIGGHVDHVHIAY